MKRNLTLRLIMGTLIIILMTVAFSFVHARASRQDDSAAGNEGKCECSKCQTPFVLWESLTRNLLISSR